MFLAGRWRYKIALPVSDPECRARLTVPLAGDRAAELVKDDHLLQQGVLTVKLIVRLALAVSCLLVVTAATALAQQGNFQRPTSQAAPAQRIALLDVGVIFDKHSRFQSEMEQMKNEVSQFEASLRTQQEDIRKRIEQAREYEPGTEPFKRIEEQVARMQAKLKIDTQLKRKEFLEREADAYYRVYREIQSVVAAYARRYQITLVFSYSTKEIDPRSRDSVLRGINRPIVYREGYLDITAQVLAQLNLGAQAQPAAAPVGGSRAQIPTGGGQFRN